MSKYTTQLRWIVEQVGSGLPVPEGQGFADAVYHYIGLDKYPIFDETYRHGLNDKIIEHFYFREIGFETAAQFAFYLRRTMNEIMPKFNKMYQAQLTIDVQNALYDYYLDRHEEYSGHDDDDTSFQKVNQATGSETVSNDTLTTNNLSELETRNMKDKTTKDLTDETTYGQTKTERDLRTVQQVEEGSVTTDQDQSSSGTTTRTPNLTTTTEDSYRDRNVYEDTPMGLLTNMSDPTIANVSYATNVTYDDHEGGSTTHDTGTETTVRSDTASNDVEVTEEKTTSKTHGGSYTHTYGGTDTVDKTGTETVDKTGTDKKDKTGTVNVENDVAKSTTDTVNENSTRSRDYDHAYEKDTLEKGRKGHSPAWLMTEFAEKWLNIDMMIIRDLEDLFMGVW